MHSCGSLRWGTVEVEEALLVLDSILPVSSPRYPCDQCPYRCHRMDQLNSHKLRHQAKSLMCEICAYACKRKYELRNHMLAKHSGKDRQSAVFKCKYCMYTTCYRQALQNHENCKHTKLKEFRCALCFYSSFSSISLFLHKRKTHGYVPGDKAWLDNYAAKEKERSSAEFMQDFYNKPSVTHKLPEGPPPSGTPEGQRDQVLPYHDGSRETSPASQPEEVFDVVSQETITESPSPIGSPEEYCTLVLTALSTSDFQNPSENSERVPTLDSNRPEASQVKADLSSEEHDEDIHDSYEPLNNTAELVEPGDCQTPDRNCETISPTFPPEHSQPLQSEVRLNAMKKYDKDQAEAMVLEGRVQMLVVPAEGVYRCEKCSYVTCRESALKHHCQALCQGRMKGHKCQACGAQFKQRRGLDGHLKKKCPAMPRKTRTFVGISETSVAPKESCTVDQEGSNSDQTEQNKISTDPECSSHSKTFVNDDAATSSASENQQTESQKKLISSNKQQKSLYSKKGGKFRCKLCSFSSVRLITIKRHLSTCRRRFRKRENETNSETGDEGGNDSIKEREELVEKLDEDLVKVSKKRQIFGCPSCAFKCSQKRALDSHERKGCMRPGEVQCALCSFVAKSKVSLTRHSLCSHGKEKFGAAKPKRLHCQHCTFSCKQQRCMTQHIALKHKGARPHRCRFCPFSTTRRYRLEEHESLHTGVGRHRCDVCDKTFGAVTKLRQHKRRIHDKLPTHFCSLCDFSSYTLDDVRRHNRRCHTGELQHVCTHCDAQFSSEVALRNHCKRVHQLQVRFSCKQCDYTCSSDITLRAHQQSKHPQVKCNTCQESFETKESLELHQRAHLAHQCHVCPFATKTRQLLAQHLLSEHEEGPAEDKALRCSTCQFACHHQLVLEQHLRSHGTKRLYKCTDCQYSTRNKQKITWHIRIHTGEKPYSCEECSYTCTDPSRLKVPNKLP